MAISPISIPVQPQSLANRPDTSNAVTNQDRQNELAAAADSDQDQATETRELAREQRVENVQAKEPTVATSQTDRLREAQQAPTEPNQVSSAQTVGSQIDIRA